MSFCKTFQTLLGYSDVGDRRYFSLPSPGGLCLIARTFHKPPYVLESSAVGKNSADDNAPSPAPSPAPAPSPTPAPAPEGFLTCTETLGVESSEERVVAEEEEEEKLVGGETAARWRRNYSTLRWRKTETAETKFPPPLPGLDQKGRPRSFLKAERKDGRFVLTEVQIERPEVFCAKREGGRLRLQVLKSKQRIEQQQHQNEIKEEDEDDDDDDDEEESEQRIREAGRREGGKGERLGRKWRYFQFHQRCHNLSDHFSPIWNSRCVTTS